MTGAHPLVRAAYYVGCADALHVLAPTEAAEHLQLASEALRAARCERQLRDQCAVIELAIARLAARMEIPAPSPPAITTGTGWVSVGNPS